MARAKKLPSPRKHERPKSRRRKPNIPELIYKFLVADEAARGTERASATKCRYCDHEKCHEEVVDSADSPRISRKSIGHRLRKDADRVSKSYRVRRRPGVIDMPASYLQSCVGGESMKKARNYIKKALEFGVESGYLIPSSSTENILCVSADLMRNNLRSSKVNACDRVASQEGEKTSLDISSNPDDNQTQEVRKRRKGRRRRQTRRSRSVSKMRGRSSRRRRKGSRRSRSRSRIERRRSSSQNPEEVTEDEVDDYEMDENDSKSNIHTNDVEKEPENAQPNLRDEEQSSKKTEEEGSDVSADEDENNEDDDDNGDNDDDKKDIKSVNNTKA